MRDTATFILLVSLSSWQGSVCFSPNQPGHPPFPQHSHVSSATTFGASVVEEAQMTFPQISIQPQVSCEMTQKVGKVWGTEPRLDNFPGAYFPLGFNNDSNHPEKSSDEPPILELPNFLSPQECRTIREWAKFAIENGADECDEYLNYRVNKEVDAGGSSAEGQALIEECELADATLSAKNKGGFRIRLDNRLVEGMLKERLLDVLDMPSRGLVFEEGAWIRPTPRSLIIRDQTVVFYAGGDGVPPHVDGKDGTLLVYLADVPEGVGGRTVFPEDGFSQTPVQGTALLYRSKTELLHYSEAMKGTNEKWIMQLLLDYNHDYQPGDTVMCFQSGTSYVWDGTK